MTMTDDDVPVSALIYKATEHERGHVYMLSDSAWVLHSGTEYWAVNNRRSIPIGADTTLAQAKALVL